MSSMKKKICLVSGTRAEYGLSYPILKAIENNPHLELQLVVTGMHLLKKYGHTLDLIREDGFTIASIIETNHDERTTGRDMADSIALCIQGLTRLFEEDRPDIVIAMTDLGFTLASAIAASHMNIPVAHVHGGDVSGCIDDSVRHATTKLSHIHFPVSKQSADRIINLGEEPWRVHNVGAPGLDLLLNEKFPDKRTLMSVLDLPISEQENYIVFVQHPVTSETKSAAEQYTTTISALRKIGLPVVLIYPNADSGSSQIINIIKKVENEDWVHVFKNLDRINYLSLIKYTSVLVGNSSSGILEAPSLKTPVVDIGNRQKGRERAENVIHTDHNLDDIEKAINMSIKDEDFKKKVEVCKNPYGDGTAGKQIADILTELSLDKKLIDKKITY